MGILLFISLSLTAQTQEYTLTRKVMIRCHGDTLISWPETIIPASIRFEKKGLAVTMSASVEDNKVSVTCPDGVLDRDTLMMHFEVLPLDFHTPVTLWDSSQIRVAEGDLYFDPVQIPTSTALFESTGLAYDGALTRGFSLGNNQSLVFDSELNLQLGGQIGDGYEIRAAITDNNLPIQPDGTTRQIQEFDKVYIEILKDQHSILAGDFDALQPAGYFMRYNRKLKGAQYTYAGIQANQPWHVKGSAAVSRGKFTRQTILPSEGNQGPYPLRGDNNELFIIVLAGSEKVYIDGRLLTRGEDADYIMDYNKSEITFTRNILINVRHRISVEFEYAQFNFQKSHNAFEARYQKEKLSSYVHFFQENDSKSVTGDLELTAEDLAILNMAGDAGEQLFKSGVRESTDGFNSNAIQYANIDTMVGSAIYNNVLVWSTDPDKAQLLVSFTEVGNNNGDYIISPDPSPNGRVYEWISPDPVTGRRRGNFVPLIPLQAPQQKQMLTTGGEYKFGHNGHITAELGYTRQDLNRYSALNDDDNGGLAIKMNVRNSFTAFRSWLLTPFAGYEGSGANFSVIDPYRNPEFNRDWNLSPVSTRSREHLPQFGMRLARSQHMFVQYQYDGLFRAHHYSGNRHTAHIMLDTSGWKISGLVARLEARDALHQSRFTRPVFNAERLVFPNGGWRIGVGFFEDRNEVRNRANDSLSVTSFIENKSTVYIKNDPEAFTHFYLTYNQERPKAVIDDRFVLSERVSEWNAGGHLHRWENFKIDYSIRHRDAEPLLLATPSRSRNLLGRLDARADLIKKALRWSAGYEIGNGQEPKVEYKYIRVQQGEGLYTWVDDGDGIEEINEFELAPFADQGEYIRLSVLNNEFIRTRALNLQQTVNIDLKNLRATGLLSKIALLSTYQLNRKIREDMDSPYWNPFYRQYADTSVLGNASTFRNIFYWNRSSTVYDIQMGHVLQENQVLQTSGYEQRNAEDLTFRTRVSLIKKMDVVFNARKGSRTNRSEFFETRNYTIHQFDAGPEVNVLLEDKFRLTGSYQYMHQINRMGLEEFNAQKFSIESVWRRTTSSDLRAQVSLVQIDYQSGGNMHVDFAILQGLQDGSNLLWSAQFNTKLNQSLVLTIQYNGRDTGEVRTIHTGTAQVRASF